MDYKRFAANRAAISYPERTGLQEETLRQADEWSNFWESVVKSHLDPSIEARTFEPVEAAKLIAEFTQWCDTRLMPLRQSLEKYSTERSQDLLNYLNFHAMAGLFSQHWYRLMTGYEWSPQETRLYNREVEDYLAIASTAEQKRRLRVANTAEGPLATINGLLSEHDTAIVLLSELESHPEHVLIPAPGKFEHGKGRDAQKNADFLLLDTYQHEVIGVQVKGFINAPKEHENDDARAEQKYEQNETSQHHQHTEYDNTFVVLVDTSTDLDDVMPVKINHSSRTRYISHPGLVAAHHIGKWPKQINLSRAPWLKRYAACERDLVNIKLYANMLTRQTHDTSERARQRIGSRVLERLYR